MRRTLAALTSLIATAVVGAPDASASSAGVCTFLGHADVYAVPVKWVGGSGEFHFQSTVAACAGLTDGRAAGETAEIDAAGDMSGLVCGTNDLLEGGALTGTGTLRDPAALPGLATFTGSFTFTIPFVAAQGAMLGTFTDGDGDSGPLAGFVSTSPDGSSQLGQLPPLPLVDLRFDPVTGGPWNDPQPPVPPVNTCIDHFAVAGSFAIG